MTAPTCRECGEAIDGSRTADFCGASCRRSFHNRRKARGAMFYDLMMATRFQRADAKASGAWSYLCKMASDFRKEDVRLRGGRRSWDKPAVVKARHPRFAAKCVAVNAAGVRR